MNQGKNGGRPKKETSGFLKIKTDGFEKKITNGFCEKKPNENVNVNENENGNVNVNDNVEASDSCDDGLARIIKFYENNIGVITPYTFELLADYTKEMSEDLIILAMQKAVEADARNINYIKAILNNWDKKKIRTVLEAQKEDQDFKHNKITSGETEEEKMARKIKQLEASEIGS